MNGAEEGMEGAEGIEEGMEEGMEGADMEAADMDGGAAYEEGSPELQ